MLTAWEVASTCSIPRTPSVPRPSCRRWRASSASGMAWCGAGWAGTEGQSRRGVRGGQGGRGGDRSGTCTVGPARLARSSSSGISLPRATRSSPRSPPMASASSPPVRRALVQRAAGKHIAVLIGADHHAAHPDVPRLRELLAELDPQSAFRVSRLDEFFQAAAEGTKPAPLDGELRWSYGYAWTLQGVHGTRAPLKRRYSAAELALTRVAEPLAALARRAGGRDRRPVLELAWRALVRCQFHDAIAGTTSDAVARAMDERLASVEALAAELVRGSVHDLVRHDPDAARERAAAAAPTLILWNPVARPRRGVMIADITLFRRDVPVGPPPPPPPPLPPRRPAPPAGPGRRPSPPPSSPPRPGPPRT